MNKTHLMGALVGLSALLAAGAIAQTAGAPGSTTFSLGQPLAEGDTAVRSDPATGDQLVATVRRARVVGVKRVSRAGVNQSFGVLPPPPQMNNYCYHGQNTVCYTDAAAGQSICFCQWPPPGPGVPGGLKGAPQTIVNNTAS